MKAKWIDFQSPMAGKIKDFVAYKHALGRQYHTEEKALRLLDNYLIEQEITTINALTPQVIDAFLCSRPRSRPRSYNHLRGVIGRLFDWLVGQGMLLHSPLHAERRPDTMKLIPFLFTTAQARQLLMIAERLPDNSRAPLRGPTYRMIFSLLYGLGLRVGEVSRLCWRDVDFARQILFIRHTKFSKSRLVPFGPRMGEHLGAYGQICKKRGKALHSDAPVFSFGKNNPLCPGTISQTFHHLLPLLNLEVPPGVRPPRLHDLRHSFAVGTLVRWYREGIDPAQRLMHLSTFLGHVSPTSTAVYLTITSELLQEANQRFERYVTQALKEVRVYE